MIVPAATSALTGPMDRSSVFSHPKRSDLGAPTSSDQVAMTAPGSDETLLAGLASGDDHLSVAFVQRFQGRGRWPRPPHRRAHTPGRRRGARSLPSGPAPRPALRPAPGLSDHLAPHHHSQAGHRRVTTSRGMSVNPELLVTLGPAPDAMAPDQLAVHADDGSHVREAIRHLPPEQRRAVLLAFFYGQTAQQISIAERIPLGTAKTRIRLGMTTLRAATPVETAAR